MEILSQEDATDVFYYPNTNVNQESKSLGIRKPVFSMKEKELTFNKRKMAWNS